MLHTLCHSASEQQVRDRKTREAFNDDSDKICIKCLKYFSFLTSYFFLGFELTIDHPHTHVVKCTQLVRGKESQLETVLLNCLPFHLEAQIAVDKHVTQLL